MNQNNNDNLVSKIDLSKNQKVYFLKMRNATLSVKQ